MRHTVADGATRKNLSTRDRLDQAEGRLTRRVSALLARQFRELKNLLEAGVEMPLPAWFEAWQEKLQELLLPELGEIAHGAHVSLLGERAPEEAPGKADPLPPPVTDWLNTYGFTLIRDITDTTRNAVANAVTEYLGGGVTLRDTVEAISYYFSADRAMAIAVTETTRAYDQGQTVAAQDLKDLGFEVKEIWNTARDGFVDDECAVRDGLPSDRWPTQERPPLHPHCRCVVDFSIL